MHGGIYQHSLISEWQALYVSVYDFTMAFNALSNGSRILMKHCKIDHGRISVVTMHATKIRFRHDSFGTNIHQYSFIA